MNKKLDVIYHQYGLFIIAILAAFLLASVSWWAIVIIEADIQDDIGESLVTVLETTQQAVNSWAKGHRAATQIWADTPEVVQLTEELLATAGTTSDDLLNAPAQAIIRDWLRPVYTGKDYQGFFIIGPDNISLASTRDSNIGAPNLLVQQQNVLEKLWSGGTAISLPQHSDVPVPDANGIMREGAPTMFVGAPIRNKRGVIIAILTFRINPAADFTAIFQRGRIGVSGETYAFDESSRLISESRFDDQLRSVGLIDQGDYGILNVTIRDPGTNLTFGKQSKISKDQQPLTLMAKSAVAGESGINLEGYRDYRGVPVIGAWMWDASLGFGMTMEIDVSEAYDVFRSIRIVIIILTFFAIGLLMGLTVIFLRNRKQITRINEELETRIEERTADLTMMSLAVEHSPVVVLMTDPQGIIEYVNRKFTEETGFERDEAIGNNPRILKSGHTTTEVYTGLWETIQSGQEWRGELFNKKKNGELYWDAVTILPIVSSDGKIQHFVGLQEDITESKLEKEMLLLTQFTLDNSTDSIHWIRPDAHFDYVNKSSCNTLGYSYEELMSMSVTDINPDYTKEIWDARWGKIKQEKALLYESRHQTKDGHIFPVEIRANYIKFVDKEYACCTVRDITERKQAEEEIKKAKNNAEAANVAKSQFLANMSHELRTPLNAIIGYSEMLQEEAEELEQKTFSDDLQKIHGAGRHLLGLINDILDLSKIEAGKLEMLVEPFSVADLLNEVTDTTQPLMVKRNNTLEVVSDGELGEMEGDLVKVRQVLFNLLSNAAKFTENGLITLTTSRETVDDRDWLTFSVSDTGIGMNSEQLSRVFEEFSQADRSTTRQYGGTGLGLTISRKLCLKMDGDISVKSMLGEGSTFTVRLPAQVEVESKDEEPELTGAFEQYDASTERGPLVLVIDDELHARELMIRHLRKAGFQVAVATSGQDGLKLARQLNPVAITLDVLMPEMDGWEVMQVLKEDPDLAEIPVVMCTVVDDEQRGFSLGASDYLTKPIEPKRLRRVLNKLCPSGDCRVLVVDDDPLQRQLICRELQSMGCQVFEAEHGRAALELLRGKIADVILLDLMMPEMDGFEFVETVQKDVNLMKIPVVVLTAKDLSSEDRLRLNSRVETIVAKGDKGLQGVIKNIQNVLRQKIITEKKTKSE